jgi:DNA topoisomerase-3
MPFEFLGKKISENQLIRLLDKNSTTNLKGFTTETGSVEGLVRFDADFKFKLEPKKEVTSSAVEKPANTDTIICPKCKKGTVLKGKSAYGCSAYKTGCDFVFTFENIKKIANGQILTKELVVKIISA